MKITTHIRSGLAFGIGLIFIAGTTVNLLSDVIWHHAELDIGHMNALLALLAALAAGHLGFSVLWRGIIIPGVLLVAVFFVATAWVAIKAGDRNAERAAIAHTPVADHSKDISTYTRMRDEAIYMLAPCPPGSGANDFGNRCGLRQAMAEECGGGKGKKCDGKAYSVRTYEAAIAGYESKIAALKASTGTPRPPEYDRAADLLASLPMVSLDKEHVRRLLVLHMPFANVFINEIMLLGILLLGIHVRITKDEPESSWVPASGQRRDERRMQRRPAQTTPAARTRPSDTDPDPVTSEPVPSVSLGWHNDIDGPARPSIRGVAKAAEKTKTKAGTGTGARNKKKPTEMNGISH
ncbi:MAG: hypothetical protein KDI55_00215 [Anaerolineae bacterium]|nr:hypothetical protein [Anaerolineae bacterium]